MKGEWREWGAVCACFTIARATFYAWGACVLCARATLVLCIEQPHVRSGWSHGSWSLCHSTRGTDGQQHTKHQPSFINNKYSVKNVFICFPVDKNCRHDLWCHDVAHSVQLEVSNSEMHGVTELDKNISLLILQKRLFRIKRERNVAARDMTFDMR